MTFRPSMVDPGVMPKPPPKPPRRGPGRPSVGRTKVMVSLEPAQVVELRREALRRAAADVSLRPDVSALVREAIADWLARRKK